MACLCVKTTADSANFSKQQPCFWLYPLLLAHDAYIGHVYAFF
jgi:hypothetical protein